MKKIFFLFFFIGIYTFAFAQDKEIFPTIKTDKIVKSFTIGYGHIIWFQNSKTDINVNSSPIEVDGENQFDNLILGVRALYSYVNTPFGFYITTNSFLGFTRAHYAEKLTSKNSQQVLNSTSGKYSLPPTYSIQFPKQILKSIMQDLGVGFNLKLEEKLMIFNLGIGMSMNFLFTDFYINKPHFSASIGFGIAGNIELIFKLNKLLGVTLGAQVGYYPLIVDSYNKNIQYKSSKIFTSAISTGISVLY